MTRLCYPSRLYRRLVIPFSRLFRWPRVRFCSASQDDFAVNWATTTRILSFVFVVPLASFLRLTRCAVRNLRRACNRVPAVPAFLSRWPHLVVRFVSPRCCLCLILSCHRRCPSCTVAFVPSAFGFFFSHFVPPILRVKNLTVVFVAQVNN